MSVKHVVAQILRKLAQWIDGPVVTHVYLELDGKVLAESVAYEIQRMGVRQ